MNLDHNHPELFVEPRPRYSRTDPKPRIGSMAGPSLLAPLSKLLRARMNWMLSMIALVMPLGLIYAVDQHYIQDRLLFTEITVEGAYDQRGARLIREHALSELDGNYLSINLQRLAGKISQSSWIPAVSAHRKWPSTLAISVTPIDPIVRWNDKQWFINTGQLLDLPPFVEVQEISDMPVLSGAQGDEYELFGAYLDYSEKFAAKGLTLNALRAGQEEVWHLELSPSALSKSRDWSADAGQSPKWVDARVQIVVNQHNAMQRISRFLATLDRTLIDQFAQIESIDLRYPNGFAVLWKQDRGHSALAMNHSG